MVYAGGGVGMANAIEEFRGFIKTTQIPTVHTLKGLGTLPYNDPLFLGMLGMHGFKQSNLAVQDCDLLICIGARFDDRATGVLAKFAPNAKVIHMDVDCSEVGKLRKAEAGISGDIRPALKALSFPLPQIAAWREECLKNKQAYAWKYNAPGEGVYVPAMLKELADRADDKTIITCDVGQHQMWVAQHYGFRRPEHHLTSGGSGAMGFGLPAAIGAALSRPDCRVICVSGDGSIMMNIQEMATLKRYNIPVKILLVDNQALGMVRQWQELFFAKKYSEIDLSDNPDFVRLSEAFGIPAFFLRERKDVLVRYISASARGWLYARDHPDEAVEHLLKMTTGLNRKSELRTWEEIVRGGYLTSITTKQHGWGYMDPAVWKELTDTMRALGQIPRPVSVEEIMTDEVVVSAKTPNV